MFNPPYFDPYFPNQALPLVSVTMLDLEAIYTCFILKIQIQIKEDIHENLEKKFRGGINKRPLSPL